jgi:ABC-type branched-subunit amino acid transport system substrate-binding protein
VNSFEGMSGHIKLKAGDRIGENYDFWTVGKDNETQNYEWKKEDNSK